MHRAADGNRRIHIAAAGVLAAAVVLASTVALRADDVGPAPLPGWHHRGRRRR